MWLHSNNPNRPRNSVEDDKEVLGGLIEVHLQKAKDKDFVACELLKLQIASCLLGKNIGIPCANGL